MTKDLRECLCHGGIMGRVFLDMTAWVNHKGRKYKVAGFDSIDTNEVPSSVDKRSGKRGLSRSEDEYPQPHTCATVTLNYDYEGKGEYVTSDLALHYLDVLVEEPESSEGGN